MITPETKANQHQTMLRMDKALHSRLAEVARAEGRSTNQQIIYYIRQALEQRAQSLQLASRAS